MNKYKIVLMVKMRINLGAKQIHNAIVGGLEVLCNRDGEKGVVLSQLP